MAKGPEVTQPCGTLAAYRRHYRNGEKPCGDCAEAARRDGSGREGYRAGRQSTVSRAVRNGLPEFRPHRYGGTGADVLTGHLADAELEMANA